MDSTLALDLLDYGLGFVFKMTVLEEGVVAQRFVVLALFSQFASGRLTQQFKVHAWMGHALQSESLLE